MKKLTLAYLSISIGIMSFTLDRDSIIQCLLNFDNFEGLTLSSLDKLPDTAPKFRDLNTKSGEKRVTRIDGYRVLYNNKFDVPFVNMKVEVCEESQFSKDTTTLIESLDYLLSVSTFMDSDELHEFEVNGYKIYGFNRNTIEQGSNLGTYVMFPGNNVTVHFYFNNLKPEYRHFETIEDYYILRDQFFQEYTNHISDCEE